MNWGNYVCLRHNKYKFIYFIALLNLSIFSYAASNEQFLLNYPNLEDSDGEVILENEHVVLQKLIVGPGEWEGIHSHPGNQIYVHIKGGFWSGRLGGEIEYEREFDEDGSVGWMDAIPIEAGHESGNSGDEAIELIYVTLKGDKPIFPEVDRVPQIYPNTPLQLILENERLIVQRVKVKPGEWEGIHSHSGGQIYIHIQGGMWSERRGGVLYPGTEITKTGAVGWMDEISLDVAHESGNTGDTVIDLIWVTLK